MVFFVVHDFRHVMSVQLMLIGVLYLFEDIDFLTVLFCLADCFFSLGCIFEWTRKNSVTLLRHAIKEYNELALLVIQYLNLPM